MKNPDRGEHQDGDWVLGKSHKLGKQFVAIVAHQRSHAKWIRGGNTVMESFDEESPEFAEIAQKELELKNINAQGEFAFAGVQFLLWVPDAEQYATLEFKSTGKDEAFEMYKNLGHAVRIKSRRITAQYTWLVPTVESLPDLRAEDIKLPTPDQTERAREIFCNLQAPKIEVIEPKKGSKESRPR